MAKKKSNNTKVNEDRVRQCKLYVDGMHCASCEVLIEKKLLKQDGVEFVDASQTSGEVIVKYKNEKPDVIDLNQEFEKLGYTFTNDKSNKSESSSPAITFNSNGQLAINPIKLKRLILNGLFIFSLFVFFLWITESGVAPDYLAELSPTSSPSLFVGLGLVAGISSCAALVGGLLLSMSKQWNEAYIASDNMLDKAQPHIMFHIGRLASFFFLGGALGALLPAVASVLGFDPSSIFSSEAFTKSSQIIVSVVMLILALQMLEISWATKIRIGLPKFISRFASQDDVQGRYTPLLTGTLTFFLPCGFTLLAQGLALASGDFLKGATIMSAFALGTAPVLAGISISSIGFNAKPHFTAKFNQIVGGFILFIALFNLFTVASNYLAASAPVESDAILAEVDAQGIQSIAITAKGADYTASGTTKIKAGVPTRLTVDNQGAVGCYAFMTGKGLFDGFVTLEPGSNEIEFTPSQPGRYWIDCAMYMVRQPVLIEVI